MLNKVHKIITFLMVVAICISLVACAGDGKTAQSSSDPSSSEGASSDIPSSNESSEDETSSEEESSSEESSEEDEASEEEESSEEEADDEDYEEDYEEEEEYEEDEEEEEEEESSEEEESDEEDVTPPSSNPSNSDDIVIREPYVDKTASENEKFVDKDHEFAFKKSNLVITKDYVIVIPKGNNEAQLSAKDLQKFYAQNFGFTLNIVTDDTAETEKEILIGKTKRSASAKNLKESNLAVSVKGKKLVFDGGHDVTADMAVGKYIRNVDLKDGKAITFALSTDFTTTPNVEGLSEYKYVWGDEFEVNGFDHTKWAFRLGMTGSPTNKIGYTEDVLDVADGRVKIHAINYYDPDDPQVLYMSPYSLATHQTMNFVYGYAEIRARVPFFEGTWPSFWGGTATALYPRDKRWHAEIDVFEIFGSENEVVPNIHKWYDDYPYEEIYNTGDVRHTTYGKAMERPEKYQLKHYIYENYENLSNEYHLYGYEWTPTELHFYVDGYKYCSMDIVNSWDLEPDMSMFQDPQYSQFNCHVFAEDGSFLPNKITGNEHMLPACYYIDYYRLYQKNDGKSKIWVNTEDLSWQWTDRYPDAKK